MRILFAIAASAIAVSASTERELELQGLGGEGKGKKKADEEGDGKKKKKAVEVKLEDLKTLTDADYKAGIEEMKSSLGDKFTKEIEELTKKTIEGGAHVQQDIAALRELTGYTIDENEDEDEDEDKDEDELHYKFVKDVPVESAAYEAYGKEATLRSDRLMKSFGKYRKAVEKLNEVLPEDKRTSKEELNLRKAALIMMIRAISDHHKTPKNTLRTKSIVLLPAKQLKLKALKAQLEKEKDAEKKKKVQADHDDLEKKIKDLHEESKEIERIALETRKQFNKIATKQSVSDQVDAANGKGNKKMWLIIVASIVAVLVIGAAVYFFVIKKQ